MGYIVGVSCFGGTLRRAFFFAAGSTLDGSARGTPCLTGTLGYASARFCSEVLGGSRSFACFSGARGSKFTRCGDLSDRLEILDALYF